MKEEKGIFPADSNVKAIPMPLHVLSDLIHWIIKSRIRPIILFQIGRRRIRAKSTDNNLLSSKTICT